MATATLTAKGQVTVPKAIRDALGLEPGDRIEFLLDAQGRVTIWPVTEDITALKGIVKYTGPPVSVEDMNAAIRERGGKM
jgi:AbrB family looped-hinge helix DNA binding protein